MPNSAYFVEQFVDTGLGNSAYLVGSYDTHLAVLIDPLRDIDTYLAAAERNSARIVGALDTHLHADFVSGVREVTNHSGAIVGASLQAALAYDHQPLVEGDELPMGSFDLRVIETPGHTPEHISFLLVESKSSRVQAVFSGGALTVGGAARTDLLGAAQAVPLARQLFHTLRDKFLPLADEVVVYPTHGAGSFCAAPASMDRVTSIGRERRTNQLAMVAAEEQFVEAALSGLPSYPAYYRYLREVNQRGPQLLGGLPDLRPVSAMELTAFEANGALVVDVRPPADFARGHIPGAYNIAVDAPLGVWAGWLLPFNAPLILVSPSPTDRQVAVRQLLRVGFDRLLGYMDGDAETWARSGLSVETITEISPHMLHERRQTGETISVLDVRQDDEWRMGHIPGAYHLENGTLPFAEMPVSADAPLAVCCAGGTRSMAGISVLRRRGFRNLLQVQGGFDAWRLAGFEVEQ